MTPPPPPPPPPPRIEFSERSDNYSGPMSLQKRHSNISTLKQKVMREKEQTIPRDYQTSPTTATKSASPQPDEPNYSLSSKSAPEQQVMRQTKPTKRMITYTGSVTSRSSNPDSLLETALSLAKSVDGYVERRYDFTITFRVPSEKFPLVYDSLLKLGEIISFQRSSEDITDAFRDTDQRIHILEKTIERYVQLLPLIKKDREKIALLKEIEQLRERLELLKVRKKTLARRADFATIHFTVQERSTGYGHYTDKTPLKGFKWISSLSPFTYRKFGAKLKYPVPKGMVRLKKKKAWSMQSPGGTRVWSGKLKNRPRADTRFWIEAVRFRLKESYQTVKTDTIGEYQVLHCIPFPGSNYRYTVAVKVIKKKIHVIQCYFPDMAQKQRYYDAIAVVLGGKAAL